MHRSTFVYECLQHKLQESQQFFTEVFYSWISALIHSLVTWDSHKTREVRPSTVKSPSLVPLYTITY